MARILVIGLHYWPEVSGNAPYTAASCEYLVDQGHEVTVITGMPHYPAWRIDSGYRGRTAVTEERAGVRIVRRAHYVPSKPTAIGRAIMEMTSFAAGSVFWPARPDAILGIVPALSGALLSRAYSLRTGAPYGLLFQDLMGRAAAQSGVVGGGRVAAVTAAIEGWAARGATAVGIVAEPFRPYLTDRGVVSGRIQSVPNWSRVASPSKDRGMTRRRLRWGPDEHIVLHSGNMGMKQGLEQVIEVAELASREMPAVRFVLMGDGNQRKSLERQARGLANTEFRAFETDAEFANVMAAADVLLLSERPSVVDMSMPSKLASYLASGRPIVAAVPRAGGTAALVERSGGGIVVGAGDPSAIVDTLRSLIADEARSRCLGNAGAAFAESELSASPGLDRVAALVGSILERRRPLGRRR